jgi:hypothetical protein
MGKGKRRQLLKQGEVLLQKYPKPPRSLNCLLCGSMIPKGEMLAHKESVHGEQRVMPSPAGLRNVGGWVSVVQGGLPSLGKRSK